MDLVKGGEEGYDIYVREGAVLNLQHRKAYDALGIQPAEKKLPKERGRGCKTNRLHVSPLL